MNTLTPSVGIWDLVHLLGAAQGFFIAIVFLFQKRGNPIANRFLGVLLLIFSLRLLEIVAFWTKYLIVFPHFSLVSFPFSYLIGVVFYFYCKHLTTDNLKFDRRFWLHALPFIIVIIYMLPYYMLSEEIKLRIIKYSFYSQSSGISGIPLPRLLIIVLQFPHALLYIGLAVRHLSRYEKNTNASIPVNKKMQVVWLKRMALGFGSFFGLWLLYNISLMMGIPYLKTVDRVITTAMTVFIYTIGYLTFQRPEIHFDILRRKGSKYEKSALTKEQAAEYLKKLHEIMESEAPYKNSNLKISDLAKKLDISLHHLSQIINENTGKNFFDFVNTYRVEEARKLLTDSESSNFTLLSIAYEVGFNNKTSFNKFFKKQTGITPSEFRSASLNHQQNTPGETN